MNFAVRSAIDFLPTFNNLQTLRSHLTLCMSLSDKAGHNSYLPLILVHLHHIISESATIGVKIYADLSG